MAHMGSLLNASIYVGPIVFVLGLAVALTCIALQMAGPDKSHFWRRLLITAALGAVGYVAGAGIGIAFFCSTASAGNLCGLGGVFGAGPAVAGLCMGAYAIVTLRARRHAP
jgi:hypothetical protein